MSSDDFSKVTTLPTYTTTRDTMDGYPGFPMSIIVTGFFVTSLAYLVCFCCCIIQFFIRRSREMRQSGTTVPPGSQKNDTLKRRFLKQFRNSLRKLQRTSTADVKSLQMIREMSTLGTTSSCSICFDEYTGDPAEILMGKIKSCGHFYHFDCIWTWLEARGNCPLCREKVALKEEDIQALALRHLLHDLSKNAQDHTLVNITDKTSNGNTKDEVSVQLEPSTESPRGVINKGFEDVDLESDAETVIEHSSSDAVAFTLGDDVQVNGTAPTDGDISSKTDVNDEQASASSKDSSEVVLEPSRLGQKNASSIDNNINHPPEV